MPVINEIKLVITDRISEKVGVMAIIWVCHPTTPLRVGFDIPTFQTVFKSDGTWERRVNPALSPTDRAIYEAQLSTIK